MDDKELTKTTTMIPVRLWTVEEYYRMADTGIIGPEERVELIEGQIIPLAAKNPAHSAITGKASDYLKELFSGLALVRIQEPVHLNSRSEPEPDIAVVRIEPRNYINDHPRPEQVFLLIEVSDSTLNFDLKNKSIIYAKAQIFNYWVIDVRAQRVFVFQEPEAKRYQQETVWGKNGILTVTAFPDIPILVENFFP